MRATSDHNNETQKMYDALTEMLDQEGRSAVNSTVMEIFNSVVGERCDFCQKQNFVVTNGLTFVRLM